MTSTNINQEGFYKIRPSARIITTIGSDLIGDSYAALIELVKNSYDADASNVDVIFDYKKIDNEDALVIFVNDDGHGMNFDTFINKWMVPGTDDKLQRKVSPKKRRPLQGRKGIGRFAASILGQEMTLVSIDEHGEQTTAVIDWQVFKSNKFLDDVQVLVEKKSVNKSSGTFLRIIAKNGEDDNKMGCWDSKSITNLINELRKLISPFSEFEKDKFAINVSFKNCPDKDINNKEYKIDTYPIIKFYDYRISGKINNKGEAELIFENNVIPESKQSEKINTKFLLGPNGKYCGVIKVDYRVFDREPDAINNLINKGLINPVTEKYEGKNEIRRLLNEAYGVNIYKTNFRIRPYGNGGVDWLDLDKDRIQNFTQRISNNQIVGFISIQSEEFSHLEEKSARDGLKENVYYLGLKELAKKALAELEVRRFTYRVKSKKSRNKHENKNLTSDVNNLFSLSEIKKSIDFKLNQLNVSTDFKQDISEIFNKEESNKRELKENIEKTIAIYQGQATLGKIVNLILHEGRKPLQFFNSETKIIEREIRYFQKTKKEEILKDLDNSIEGFRINTNTISGLFKRISPLANQRRGVRVNFAIIKVLNESYRIFKNSFDDSGIKVTIDCPEKISLCGWAEDLYAAITNMLENSFYWLSLKKGKEKEIKMKVSESSESVLLDFIDNGPGLTDLEIDSEIIFEPGYSKKLNGTGLGLAIAGEAINRLNGKLIVRKYDHGSYFQMEFIK